MRIILAFVFILLFIQSTNGVENETSDANIIDVIKECCKHLNNNDTLSMTEVIYNKSPPIPGYKEIINSFISKIMTEKIPHYGKLKSAILVSRAITSWGAAKYVFVLKFENTFLTWSFKLYHSNNGWVIKSFNIDDPMDEFKILPLEPKLLEMEVWSREKGNSPVPVR